MAKLILIKHATPLKDPARPASEWPLSDAGREQAGRLANRLRDEQIGIVVSSDEPKAIETGRIVAEMLNVPHETHENLHEHDRSNVPMMPTREFISSIALFFREPDRLVLGRETASAAAGRFREAVESVMRKHDPQNVAIVSHGTVMSLLLRELGERDPFDLWRALGLPSYVVIDWSNDDILRIVERIA